ncbi:MAG: hypothetical protein K2M37_00955 [Muribaculaceae bacterium]|nr:hypothetical protein [Muribaculaceae bacterium]
MAMVSCGGNKAAETADTDTVVAAVEEVVADSNETANVAAVEAVDGADTTVAVAAEATPAN